MMGQEQVIVVMSSMIGSGLVGSYRIRLSCGSPMLVVCMVAAGEILVVYELQRLCENRWYSRSIDCFRKKK